MAARNSGMPDEGVYLVKPSLSAAMAASLMCCGVSKSGSPAPKPQTSTPSALSCLALASIARVSDGVRVVARCASCCMLLPLELALVKLFDERLQVVFGDVDDAHFAFGVFRRIAGVSGVDHDVLAEFAADRARGRLARVGRPEHAADLVDGVGALVDHGHDLFETGLRLRGIGGLFGMPAGHELHNLIELLIGELDA